MSGILDLLNSDLGKTIISGVSNQTNQPAIISDHRNRQTLFFVKKSQNNSLNNPFL